MGTQQQRVDALLEGVPNLTPIRREIVHACYKLNGQPRDLVRLVEKDREVKRRVLQVTKQYTQSMQAPRPSANTLAQPVTLLQLNTFKEVALKFILSGGRR
jgi:hypothetical protein